MKPARRILLILATLAGIAVEAQVSFLWEQRASLPAAGRYGAFSFAIGNYAYVAGGGNASGTLSECWRYDPQADAWQQMASMPAPRRHGAAFSVNGKGYVACGQQGTTAFSNTLYEYDPATDMWAVKAALSAQARYGSFGFAAAGFGFVGAGNYGSSSGPYLDDMWRYDPTMNSWAQVAGIPGLPRYGSTGFAMGTKGYAHGGQDSSLGFTNELWEYDPVLNTWTAKPPMPGSGRSWTMVMPFAFEGVVAGGKDVGLTVFYDGYRYYPPTDAWTMIPDYPGQSGWSGASFAVMDRTFGGMGARLSPSYSYWNDLWELIKVDFSSVASLDPAEGGIHVFPNPVTGGEVRVDLPEGVHGRHRARVIDAAGHMVLDASLQRGEPFNVSGLCAGIYQLEVQAGGQVFRTALVLASD